MVDICGEVVSQVDNDWVALVSKALACLAEVKDDHAHETAMACKLADCSMSSRSGQVGLPLMLAVGMR